jgi:hypothetical protein
MLKLLLLRIPKFETVVLLGIGGLYYKCSVGARLGREGEGELAAARHLTAGHLDILKITCLRRLKEEYKGKYQ